MVPTKLVRQFPLFLPASLILNELSGAAGEFLPALLTETVILQPSIRYPELGFSGYFFRVDNNRDPVIHNPVAFFANQINVVGESCLVTILHFVKFQHLYDSMPGKLIQGEINR